MSLNRRDFVRSVLGTVSLPMFVPQKAFGANDRIRLATIGCGRRATQIVVDSDAGEKFPGELDWAVYCDCIHERADAMAAKFQKRAMYNYRRVLHDKDIDAVLIMATTHWHAQMVIEACMAGKDIYVEKPLGLTIDEGKAMVRAARKYNRVVQVGTQQRSLPADEVACRILRTGAMGKINRVVVPNYGGMFLDPLPGVGKPPPGTNWEMWLGQAPRMRYNPAYLDISDTNPHAWHNFRQFQGGTMTGLGAHGFDMVQWALGMDGSGPVEVSSENSEPDPGGMPKVTWKYANGVVMESRDNDNEKIPWEGGKFFCERGQLNINRNRFNIMPAALKRELTARFGNPEPSREEAHVENFLECMRTRGKPVADVEIGHRSVTVAHLGNIARELGGTLHWNPVTERFIGNRNREADALMSRERRQGYELPDV